MKKEVQNDPNDNYICPKCRGEGVYYMYDSYKCVECDYIDIEDKFYRQVVDDEHKEFKK